MRSSERCCKHRWLQSEVEEAGEQPAAIGGLQFAAAWVDAAEFTDSEEAVVVDPRDQQLGGTLHHARGQCHIGGHSTSFDLVTEDRDIVDTPGRPRARFAEHVCAVLEESAVVDVPLQVRNWSHLQHGEDVDLVEL